jgi:hypothetical protein
VSIPLTENDTESFNMMIYGFVDGMQLFRHMCR